MHEKFYQYKIWNSEQFSPPSTYATFETDVTKSFVNKIYHANRLSAEEIPTCVNLALGLICLKLTW